MGQVTAAPRQVEISEPGRYVAVTPNDYLDIRSQEWAAHEAGGRVRFFARMVHVDRACTDILRAIDVVHPGTHPEITALLESISGETADATPPVRVTAAAGATPDDTRSAGSSGPAR